MGELNLKSDQLKELKNLIEVEAQNYLQDEEVSKESLTILSKNAEDQFGIKKGDFKKIAKAYFKASIEEDTEKAIQLKALYQEILTTEKE